MSLHIRRSKLRAHPWRRLTNSPKALWSRACAAVMRAASEAEARSSNPLGTHYGSLLFRLLLSGVIEDDPESEGQAQRADNERRHHQGAVGEPINHAVAHDARARKTASQGQKHHARTQGAAGAVGGRLVRSCGRQPL